MQALILVGGEGTRLRPLTETLPKPVLPLVDRPFVSYMVDWLGGHGVDRILMACGFKSDAIREVLGDGRPGGPRISYIEEPEPLGTAGAIRFAEDQLDERFLALNGDLLTDLDLTALIRFHEQRQPPATLGLFRVEDPTGYGLVRHDAAGRVTEFIEKPEEGAVAAEINAGIYVLERSVLGMVPEGREVSIEREIFPRLIGEGLRGFPLDGYWMDIGTPDRYLQASWDILERQVRTAAAERLNAEGSLVEEGVDVEAGALIRGPALVQSPARLGRDALVGPRAVVAAGCEVAAGARVEGSVLMAGSRVGEEAVVREAILGPGAVVEAGAEPPPGCVLGDGERAAA